MHAVKTSCAELLIALLALAAAQQNAAAARSLASLLQPLVLVMARGSGWPAAGCGCHRAMAGCEF
jgi:hypothetical protein